MSCKDTVKPFVFESLPVRGSLVQLDSAWQRMQLGHDYVRSAAEILGHAAAATALLAAATRSGSPWGSRAIALFWVASGTWLMGTILAAPFG